MADCGCDRCKSCGASHEPVAAHSAPIVTNWFGSAPQPIGVSEHRPSTPALLSEASTAPVQCLSSPAPPPTPIHVFDAATGTWRAEAAPHDAGKNSVSACSCSDTTCKDCNLGCACKTGDTKGCACERSEVILPGRGRAVGCGVKVPKRTKRARQSASVKPAHRTTSVGEPAHVRTPRNADLDLFGGSARLLVRDPASNAWNPSDQHEGAHVPPLSNEATGGAFVLAHGAGSPLLPPPANPGNPGSPNPDDTTPFIPTIDADPWLIPEIPDLPCPPLWTDDFSEPNWLHNDLILPPLTINVLKAPTEFNDFLSRQNVPPTFSPPNFKVVGEMLGAEGELDPNRPNEIVLKNTNPQKWLQNAWVGVVFNRDDNEHTKVGVSAQIKMPPQGSTITLNSNVQVPDHVPLDPMTRMYRVFVYINDAPALQELLDYAEPVRAMQYRLVLYFPPGTSYALGVPYRIDGGDFPLVVHSFTSLLGDPASPALLRLAAQQCDLPPDYKWIDSKKMPISRTIPYIRANRTVPYPPGIEHHNLERRNFDAYPGYPQAPNNYMTGELKPSASMFLNHRRFWLYSLYSDDVVYSNGTPMSRKYTDIDPWDWQRGKNGKNELEQTFDEQIEMANLILDGNKENQSLYWYTPPQDGPDLWAQFRGSRYSFTPYMISVGDAPNTLRSTNYQLPFRGALRATLVFNNWESTPTIPVNIYLASDNNGNSLSFKLSLQFSKSIAQMSMGMAIKVYYLPEVDDTEFMFHSSERRIAEPRYVLLRQIAVTNGTFITRGSTDFWEGPNDRMVIPKTLPQVQFPAPAGLGPTNAAVQRLGHGIAMNSVRGLYMHDMEINNFAAMGLVLGSGVQSACIENVEMSGNSWFQAIIEDNSVARQVLFRNCGFSGSDANGGFDAEGVDVEDVAFIDCRFVGNVEGPGAQLTKMVTWGAKKPLPHATRFNNWWYFCGCLFSGNRVGLQVVFGDVRLHVENCCFMQNLGAGIVLNHGHGQILNSHFYRNGYAAFAEACCPNDPGAPPYHFSHADASFMACGQITFAHYVNKDNGFTFFPDKWLVEGNFFDLPMPPQVPDYDENVALAAILLRVFTGQYIIFRSNCVSGHREEFSNKPYGLPLRYRNRFIQYSNGDTKDAMGKFKNALITDIKIETLRCINNTPKLQGGTPDPMRQSILRIFPDAQFDSNPTLDMTDFDSLVEMNITKNEVQCSGCTQSRVCALII